MEKGPSGTGSPYREKQRAKGLLARMRLIEKIRREQRGAPREDRPEFWTKKFVETYRGFIGVAPADRETLRAALEGIIAGARLSVADVVAGINAGTFTQMESPAEGESEAGLSDWL